MIISFDLDDTFLRSVGKIRWMFYTYGIRLDKVINLSVHERILRAIPHLPLGFPATDRRPRSGQEDSKIEEETEPLIARGVVSYCTQMK